MNKFKFVRNRNFEFYALLTFGYKVPILQIYKRISVDLFKED